MANDTPGGDRFRFAPPNPNGHVEPFHYSVVGTFEGKPTPERRWLVPGWIPQGQVTMLSGDGGIGKSLLAQQLMTAAALGRNWLGLSVTPCKTLALFLEDDEDELQRRQEAINLSYECAFADLENNMAWISMVGVGVELADFSQYDGPQPSDAYHRLVAAAIEFGAGLVVLDSLHDVFSGNEINRYQARWFIRLLQDLAQAIDGAVVLTAHPSLSGLSSGSGMSGSTAWNNAVRSRLYLHRPEGDAVAADESERILTRKKSNYARAGESLALNWCDGVFAPVHQTTGIVASMERRRAEAVFLDLLCRSEAEGRPVSDNPRASNHAPKMFARRSRSMREGYVKRDFEIAMETLFSDSKIERVSYRSPDRHLREKIAMKEAV